MALPIVSEEFRVVGDPDLKFTPSGSAVANFRAVTSSRKKNESTGEWENDKDLWVNVTVWRELAENLVESVKDKDLVVVTGKLYTRTFEHNGQKKVAVELEASAVGPSLRFRKQPHGQASQPTGQGQGDPWVQQPQGQQQPYQQPAQGGYQQPYQQQPPAQQPYQQPAQGGYQQQPPAQQPGTNEPPF